MFRTALFTFRLLSVTFQPPSVIATTVGYLPKSGLGPSELTSMQRILLRTAAQGRGFPSNPPPQQAKARSRSPLREGKKTYCAITLFVITHAVLHAGPCTAPIRPWDIFMGEGGGVLSHCLRLQHSCPHRLKFNHFQTNQMLSTISLMWESGPAYITATAYPPVPVFHALNQHHLHRCRYGTGRYKCMYISSDAGGHPWGGTQALQFARN